MENTNDNKEVELKQKEEQEAVMKGIKTKQQIEAEMKAKLTAASGNKDFAVAAALTDSIPTQPKKQQAGPTIIRRFEVTLYEEDEAPNGDMIQKIVNGGKPEYIEATSPADLNEKLSLYRQCGQTPKIKPIGEPMVLNPDGSKTPYHPESMTQQKQQSATLTNQQVQQPIEQKKPIKYYKIGGIEVKDDNGKIYQKQWMRLSEAEAKNIRIVNDKTNAIVALSGKHLEMTKWIPVEDSENDDITSMEDNLNE